MSVMTMTRCLSTYGSTRAAIGSGDCVETRIPAISSTTATPVAQLRNIRESYHASGETSATPVTDRRRPGDQETAGVQKNRSHLGSQETQIAPVLLFSCFLLISWSPAIRDRRRYLGSANAT